ncbi:MAG: SBBP repeat-containing protein [Betaproteobacteria bacterium]|nr:SBBP repeat-containing protein [Betaproteobacteria bacterium]
MLRTTMLLVVLLASLFVQRPVVAADFARNYGGTVGATVMVEANAVDALGNSYVAGHFDSATLAVGNVTLTRIGSADGFVAKVDANGNTIWARNFGGSGVAANGQSIAVDVAGSVYLTGSFESGNLTTPALARIGKTDAFVIKLDATGATAWARNFGGTGAVASARGGRPGRQRQHLPRRHLSTCQPHDTATNHYRGTNAFAIKLDATGATTWARNFGGPGAGARGHSIAVDDAGNAYLSGDFFGANLTAPALALIGYTDAFAIKLDAGGATTWARNFGGSIAHASGQSIAVDGAGDVYLGGTIAQANLTTPPLTRIGGTDALAIKLDATGAIVWARNIGGVGAFASSQSLAVDDDGNVYLGGSFHNASVTDPA